MLRLLAPVALIAISSACIAIDASGPHRHPGAQVQYNTAPYVVDGYAACTYDATNAMDAIQISTDVGDDNGIGDVVAVWADIYDPSGNQLLSSAELYPTTTPSVWSTYASATQLGVNCWAQGYSVDLYAYDNADTYGALAVWLQSYSDSAY